MLGASVRHAAAALAVITAIFYFLIAAHVLPVVDVMDGGITKFGLAAGIGFCLIAVALLVWKRRFVWIIVGLLQVFSIAMYFQVGQDRTPNYEVWGIVMRIPQALILFSMAYLSLRKSAPSSESTTAR